MNPYINRLYIEFMYGHSIAEMLLWGVLLAVFWLACAIRFAVTKREKKMWAWVNRLFLILYVLFILWYTILDRSSEIQEISLIPFYSFVLARDDPWRYPSMVANILLFVPFGLFLPFVLHSSLIPRGRGARHPVRITLIAAAALSVVIEIAQMIFQLGYCETDDIIFNTAGAALGTLAYAGYVRLSDY